MKKIIPPMSICFLISLFSVLFAAGGDVVTVPVTKENLLTMPVPTDLKNYFFVQAFEKVTNIVIGDFGGSEKRICLISDKGGDGTVDEVWEYYPDSGLYSHPEKPTTLLYTGYPQMKKDIIEGKVFNKFGKGNQTEYTHVMVSLTDVKEKINEGRFVTRWGHDGRYVRITDPDIKNSTMADFYFGKESGAYSLQFKTTYYKNGPMKIEPTIRYSIYARRTKDAVIVEYVEQLLKMAKDKKI